MSCLSRLTSWTNVVVVIDAHVAAASDGARNGVSPDIDTPTWRSWKYIYETVDVSMSN